MIKSVFDILFSIKIEHDYYVDEPCADFVLVPTVECQHILHDYGLIFRSGIDGGMAIYEKNDKSEIVRKLNRATGLTFLLKLKTPIFDNYTRLVYPKEGLGRKIYYFSNLTDAGAIDASLSLAKSADNKVGNKDIGWFVGPTLDVSLNNLYTKVDLCEVPPKGVKKVIESFNVTGLKDLKIDLLKLEVTPNNFIKLKKGKYLLEFAGANPKTEHIYFDENIALEEFWGIVEIDKDEATNYAVKREHKLTFRTERWKYYLIDPTNKITLDLAGNAFTNLTTASSGQPGLAFEWIKEIDIENDSHEKGLYKLLKDRNAGIPIYLLRSTQQMKKPAEALVKVKISINGAESSLPTPLRTQSKLEVIQKI